MIKCSVCHHPIAESECRYIPVGSNAEGIHIGCMQKRKRADKLASVLDHAKSIRKALRAGDVGSAAASNNLVIDLLERLHKER